FAASGESCAMISTVAIKYPKNRRKCVISSSTEVYRIILLLIARPNKRDCEHSPELAIEMDLPSRGRTSRQHAQDHTANTTQAEASPRHELLIAHGILFENDQTKQIGQRETYPKEAKQRL